MNYIIIGDSITYGIGDFETGGWSSMFKNYIVNKDDSKSCNNYVHLAAFPGATSTDILNKILYIYNAFKRDNMKNFVMLSIGVNDTQEFNGELKTSLDKYKNNMIRIINYFKEQNAGLVIMGLSRIQSDEKFFWKPGKYYNNAVINEYDIELERICNENGVEYLRMSDVLSKEDFIDGIHPNQQGYFKIFNRIEQYHEQHMIEKAK